MTRLVAVLLAVLAASAVLAGCAGGDDDGGGTTTTTTTTATTNTTAPPPNVPPVPVIDVNGTRASGGNGSVVLSAKPETNFTVTLDASASSDPDGTITNFAWIVRPPEGDQLTGTNETFVLNFTFFKAWGVYAVILRVLDDRNAVEETNATFTINYENSYVGEGIPGPGTGDNNDPGIEAQYSCLNDVCTGTYGQHTFTVNPAATSVELDVSYESSQGTITLRVFPPGAESDSEDHILEEDVATDGGTFTIEAAELTASGTYTARLDVDGAGVEGYTLGVRVLYG